MNGPRRTVPDENPGVDVELAAVRVAVAVPTYRRPDHLARLLPVLVEQCLGLTARILVVDNDPSGGAEDVVRPWSHAVSYLHEPAPGIAAARNRALDAAAGDDVLVFIDDDELPGPGWPAELVRRWVEWRCTAVAAPVRWDLTVDAPWARASAVLRRSRRPTGATVQGAATNNLLLDVAATRALGLRFDERFGLSGGEDTMFTRLLVRRGGTIRWCDEAEVVEPVPAHRATRRWLLRRTFRAGTTWSRIHLLLAGPRLRRERARLGLLGRGVLRIATGSLRLAAGAAGRHLDDRAQGLCTLASGAGMVLGALGYTHQEYTRRAPRRDTPSGGAR